MTWQGIALRVAIGIRILRVPGSQGLTASAQLGLKLAPEKRPVEFLVIDHVEKPAEN